MSSPTELLEALDAGLSAAQAALDELHKTNIEHVDLLELYKKLELRSAMVSDLKTKLRDLTFKIGAERHHRWATSERYYVYVSEHRGEPVEPSLHALGEASGLPWHDLRFAAHHWRRMEQISNKPSAHRKGTPSRYWVMAYDPNTGRIRKVTQEELIAALSQPD